MARRPREKAPLSALGLSEGDAVIVYLQAPKEKVWGLLLSLQAAGIVLRCIDLAAFDDWMRQEARRDEPYLGLTTVRQPLTYSGARGARLLLDLAAGWRPESPVVEKLSLELVNRRTTAAPPR